MSKVEFELISADEAWDIFDERAQDLLGVSASEFVQAWENGEYADDVDTDVMRVAMLRPSGR